jgi:N6-adenosine-specific RNA methylase IME4
MSEDHLVYISGRGYVKIKDLKPDDVVTSVVDTGGSLKSGSSAVYPVMTVPEICSLPVDSICDDNCVLFMWWVASQPQEALDVVKGF